MSLFEDLSDEESRGFARLVADAMRPHLKRAMDEAVSEYMGQNGEEHRLSHAALSLMIQEREEVRVDSKAMTRQIRIGVTIALIVLAVNIVAALGLYWITNLNRAQIEEVKREVAPRGVK